MGVEKFGRTSIHKHSNPERKVSMNYQKYTDRFVSSDGKTAVSYYTYVPQNMEPKAILQISHGMCEFIERYEDFAGFLCDNGFIVCGNDHLGHGNSISSEEDLGYFGEENGYEYLVTDLYKTMTIVRKSYPNLPYFMLGHSMGSFVARMFLTQYGKELTGAVICGTSGGNPFAGMGIRMAKSIARKKGGHFRSKKLDSMAFQGYNKRIDKPQSRFDWLTTDPQIVSDYEQNPKNNFIFTAAGFKDLFTLVKLVSAKEWADKVPKNLPLFLIAGEEDPVGEYGKGVRKVCRRLIEADVQDIALHLYPGGRHEIINESNRKDVYIDIARWMDSKI